MNLLDPILLGALQGLTEFIPVSSSGHLYIFPKIFNAPAYLSSTSFILFLHLGTLLALLIYYRKLIIKYVQVSLRYLKSREPKGEDKKDILVIRNVILGTIPAGLIGLIVDKFLSNLYDEQIMDKNVAFFVVAIPMIIMGLLFIFETRIIKGNDKNIEDLSINKTLTVGLSQAIAFIRGVSRSGITLLSGQFAGLSRVSAAEFSFLISIPIISASSLLEVIQFIKDSSSFSSDLIAAYILGAVTSFVIGLFAINFLLKFLRTRSLAVFGYYRVYFGVFLIFLIIFR
ncbi:MAG: undecaprenyl-diphosphate phosphatase [Candidatus Dojkabacteria bacterium]